ncbi:hypothetical protein [Tenacibaculum halocynthiae]|uniref:hypothetical protein n=1 Tax=Tenacibaculum halocynthiae TaxID=1254437 RepID=UPI00389550D7
MNNKIIYFFLVLLLLSCSKNEITTDTLQTYITQKSHLAKDEVIACAASDKNNTDVSYIFYYPILGATNIQYFETESVNSDKNDFTLYNKVSLEKEDVFNGYLQRFVRESKNEVWSIVTYESNNKLHISNPIRLKNSSKPTEWSTSVSIDTSTPLMPKFSWGDGKVKENAIYFQVVTNSDNDLLSGTYTYDKWFQYYKTGNVVLNVTRDSPPILIKNKEYHFTMMGVSEDNWVNLVIQKQFIGK